VVAAAAENKQPSPAVDTGCTFAAEEVAPLQVVLVDFSLGAG
jgi:hypothetical protein